MLPTNFLKNCHLGNIADIKMKAALFLLSCIYLGIVKAQGGIADSAAYDGDFGLSEFEIRTTLLPKRMKCDGCVLNALEIFTQFDAKSKKNTRELGENEVYELCEQSCEGGGNFAKYYFKNVKGDLRLAGPGLSADEESGSMHRGRKEHKWQTRLVKACTEVVEENEEYNLYKTFRKIHDGPKPTRTFAKMICKKAEYCTGKEDPKRFQFKDDYKKGKKPKRKKRTKKERSDKTDRYEL